MSRIPGHSSRGLCITGFLILATGAASAYLVRTYGNAMVADEPIRMILLATAIGSGICFISATARWWMRH